MTVPTAGPVFITGLDHGGKTPLRVVLDRIPTLALLRRAYLWTWFDGRFGPLAEPANLRRCVAALKAHRALASLDLDVGKISRQFAEGPASYDHLFMLIGQAYAESRGASRWGMQESNLERHAARLLSSDPSTRIVHLVRDPRSWYAAVSADAARRGGIGVAAAVWGRSSRLALRLAAHHPGRYGLVRYEDFAADPAATVEGVCRFIGEPAEPAVLAAAAGLRLSTSGHELPARCSVYFETELADVMTRLGYHGASELRWRDAARFRLLTRPVARLMATGWSATERWPTAGELIRGRATARKVRLDDAR
ncbi:MAG: sulfotransferase [Chloroflexota bacterium]